MAVPLPIESAYLHVVDRIFERRPQPRPPLNLLQQCKIISHRGEHRAGLCAENSLDAFDRAVDAGVWGIELDVRWTRDRVPVVAHDDNLHRLSGQHCDIARSTCASLQVLCPALTRLSDVVGRYGGRLHLMIEIKQQEWVDLSRQQRILSEILDPLIPGTDYHVMSLVDQILVDLSDIPRQAKVPIAYTMPDRQSRSAMTHRWGGISGHYLMMRGSIVDRHKAMGQRVGTGFANSIPVLYRELNRGIDWIFSNRAAHLQAHVNRCLSAELQQGGSVLQAHSIRAADR